MHGAGDFASARFCMFSLIILSLATGCSQKDPPSLSSSMMADMVLINGKIITMDPDQPRASGLAVKDGRIIAVGDGDWIEALVGSQTIRVDLR
ncbi:MAG: hypothetical protein V3U86_00510, partial [Acidobacteriota bacterium]